MMKTRLGRRAIALASVAALAGALSACSASDDGGSTSADDRSLEVWTRSTPDDAASYQFVFDAFTAKTGIRIDYKPVPEFDTQLQARAQQKSLPDVMVTDAGNLGTYESQGFLRPVDRDAVAGGDQISDATWQSTRGTDGDYYGVPWSRQAAITFIRKDWREKLGLPVPTTWDELSALAKAFADDDPDGDGQADTYGMVVPGSAENGYIARWAASYIWQAGGDILRAGGDGTYTADFDTPGTETAVEWIRDQFCTPGVVVPGSVNLTTANTPFFAQGTAGIYQTGPYNLSSFDAAVGKDNVEVIPTPAGPDGGTDAFAEGENVYFGASSKKQDLQQQLAEFMITPEAQELAMQAKTNDQGVLAQPVVRIPVNTSVDIGTVKDDPRWDTAKQVYDQQGRSFPWAIDFTPYRQIVADGLNGVIADCSSDIPGALSDIQSQLSDELDEQGVQG